MHGARGRGGVQPTSLVVFAVFLECCTSVTLAGAPPNRLQPDGLEASGVTALLAVMDTIAALHPGFESKELDTLSPTVRDSFMTAARGRNEASETLQDALDALFDTPTYRLYFERFSNVTPELVRGFLLDLPYRARPSPGGVADTYYALVRDRDSVRALVNDFVATFDVEAMQRRALYWVPDGEYHIPVVRLIYDSNAGSFTAGGSPFFNLYSEQVNLGTQQDSSLDSFVTYAEGVMAHEVQHVLARPLLYPQLSTEQWSWQRRWVEAIVRGMVSEGVATHCNPPSGIRQKVWEDRAVLGSLARSLEETLRGMRDGSVTEEEVRAWYRDSFQDMPLTLLRRHFERTSNGAELESKVRRYASMRPDLEHALGWWMASRISERGARRSEGLDLLIHPATLFARYNRALSGDDAALRVKEDVVSYVEETMR